MPVVNVERPDTHHYQRYHQDRPLIDEFSHFSLIEDRKLLFLLKRFHLRFKHDGSRTGDSAVFPDTPEMHSHKYRRDQRNTNAVPDIRTQQCIRVDDRPAQQSKTNVVISRQPELWTKRSLLTEHRCGTGLVGPNGNGPKPNLAAGHQE